MKWGNERLLTLIEDFDGISVWLKPSPINKPSNQEDGKKKTSRSFQKRQVKWCLLIDSETTKPTLSILLQVQSKQCAGSQ
jgi:hypothetical protein